MDTVVITTIADVRRYHRHLDRAAKAGFSANAEGLQAYKQFVKAKRSKRALQSSSLTVQRIMNQALTQNYRDASVLPGIESLLSIKQAVDSDRLANSTPRLSAGMIGGIGSALGSITKLF